VVRRWKLRQMRIAADAPVAPPMSIELDEFRERARKETEI